MTRWVSKPLNDTLYRLIRVMQRTDLGIIQPKGFELIIRKSNKSSNRITSQ